MAYPASTKRGSTITMFPDVCKTPTPGGPVPIPYPNISGLGTATGQKTARKTSTMAPQGVPVPTPSNPQQLRAKLTTLHGQLLALPGTNPDRWHTLLDEYVMTTASLYIALASR
jgi:hypothetical protein